MKFYKCDMCDGVFDPKDGMTKGWYKSGRKIRWNNFAGEIKDIKIIKTMKVYTTITDAVDEYNTEAELDLCRSCVMKFEKP